MIETILLVFDHLEFLAETDLAERLTLAQIYSMIVSNKFRKIYYFGLYWLFYDP